MIVSVVVLARQVVLLALSARAMLTTKSMLMLASSVVLVLQYVL